ncbi:MAG: hypothetical protein IJE65_05715 [Clostridia bacterium]|nr:hypothetical protein [Clostridia bacterium]
MLTLKKIVSLILAITMIVLAVIPANANSDTSTDDIGVIDMVGEVSISQDKMGSAEKRETITVDYDYHRSMITRSCGAFFAARNAVSEWDFSTHFGYDYLSSFENGDIMQAVYFDLYSLCVSLMNDNYDIECLNIAGGNFYIYGYVYEDEYQELTDKELMEIYFLFKNDFPQFYWLSNIAIAGGGAIYVAVFDEFATGGARAEYSAQYQAAADQIIWQASRFKTKFEKAEFVHDIICKKMSYASDSSSATGWVDNGFTHSIIGALVKGSGVCDGYSKAFQYIMNRLGINCLLITGDANGSHAWNLVEMDNGEYYFLDLTWDDIDIGNINLYYDYFLIDSDEFLSTHTPLSPMGIDKNFASKLPHLSHDNSYSFYNRHHLYISEYSLKNYSSVIRNSIELYKQKDSSVGYLKFDESISAADISNMLGHLTYFAEMLETTDGKSLSGSFSCLGNEYFYAFTEDGEYDADVYGVTLYDDGKKIGKFNTVNGAVNAMENDGSEYTIELGEIADIYPYTEFPANCSVTFKGNEDSYLYIHSDITFDCDITFDTVVLYGLGYFDEGKEKTIQYTDSLTEKGDVYLANIILEFLKKIIKGDLDGDKSVTAADILNLEQYFLGLLNTDGYDDILSITDINDDSIVDSTDLMILQMNIINA